MTFAENGVARDLDTVVFPDPGSPETIIRIGESGILDRVAPRGVLTTECSKILQSTFNYWQRMSLRVEYPFVQGNVVGATEQQV